jgi:tripartite-type tricarboxylate transporter receptor subunit TctC
MTKLSRRRFVQTFAAGAALSPLPRLAWAQTYPTRLVRVVVPYPPGASTDITARLVGQSLSDRLGQPFVVENRPGAGGNIGTDAVAKSAPDGYTLLLVYSSNAINATLYEKLSFNFIRDIAPVAAIMRVPNVVVVHPSVSAKTIPAFIELAKANPGKLNMASGGNGSTGHLAGELFKTMAGIDLVHVPYRGGAPALTDLIAGQVQVFFAPMPAAIEYIRTGKLRALGVTTPTRSEVLPDIPPVGDFVPGYEASTFLGIGAPKNTPPEIIQRLNKDINLALADPRVKERLADLSGTELVGSSADFGKLIAEETEKWAKVIKVANIKAD